MEESQGDFRRPVGERLAAIETAARSTDAMVAELRPKIDAVLLTVAEIKANQLPLGEREEMRRAVADHEHRLDVAEKTIGERGSPGLLHDVDLLMKAHESRNSIARLFWKAVGILAMSGGLAWIFGLLHIRPPQSGS